MSEIIKPSNLSLTWASGGDVLDPGDTKYATGWQVEIPPRQWFNFLDNRQDEAIAHINQHGIAVWDSLTEYQAGKSYVTGSDGNIYKAVTTNININPTTDGGTNWTRNFVQSATDTLQGIVEFATNAEVLAGTDTTRAVTPASLVAGLLGVSSLNTSGYATVPVSFGGIRQNWIVQWGSTVAIASGANTTTAFPIVFPTACFKVFTTVASGVNITQAYTGAVSSTPAQASFVTYSFGTAGGSASYHWIAVGY